MGKIATLVLAASVLAISAVPARADVQVSWNAGRVTIVAKDATVRQILAEWARVGQTRIVNSERVTGGPITLELVDVTEKQALDIILRSVSGYIAAPRPGELANASRFDRILIFPTPPQARSASSGVLPSMSQTRSANTQANAAEANQDNDQTLLPPGPPPVPPRSAPASAAPPPAPFAGTSAPGVTPTPAAVSATAPTSAPAAAGTRAPGVMPTPPPTSPGVQPARF